MAEQFDSADSKDDYNPHGEHVVEIPARHHAAHSSPRRSYATLGVAAFLALTGIGVTVGLVSDASRRAKDEVAQREELRVGWEMLGTLAANGSAQHSADGAAASTSPVAAQPAAAQPVAAPNVIVVNVPAQATPSQTGPAAVMPAPNAPAANSSVPTTTAIQATPSAGATPGPAVIAQPLIAGTSPPAIPNQVAPSGASTAAAPTPSLPTGSVAVSPPDSALPTGSVPAASNGPTFPASQMCGLSTCNTGSVCCNASCGICTEPGATCSQQPC